MHGVAGALLSMVFFAVVAGVPLIVIAAVAVFVLRAQRRREELWANVAHRFSLQVHGSRMWGLVDGQPVQVVRELRGGGKQRVPWTVVSCVVSPPLDLGLCVTPQGTLSPLWNSLTGQVDLPVGDPAFDDAFVVRGDEHGRVHVLLDPALRGLLLSALRHGTTMTLGDAGLKIEQRGDVTDASWLEWALRVAAQTGLAMERARWNVPAATPLMVYRAAWDDFARARGLRGMSTPLCMWGMLGTREVRVYAVRVAELAYQLEIFVRYPDRLGLDLLVRPNATFDSLSVILGGQDVRVGDPVFDPAFRVKAARADRVPAVLDPAVRDKMIRLHGVCSSLEVRDDGVALRTTQIPLRPDDALALLGEASSLADRVWNNARRLLSVGTGAYR